MTHRSNIYIIGFVFIPFMGAYLLSELFRNINSTIGPVLQQEFALDAATLGLMTSLFLFAVAGSQLFTGILLDRLGARRTVAMLLIIAAIGVLLFTAGTFTTLLVGLLLIGIGMSGCWTAAFKVNGDLWPKDRLALANGAIIGLAGLGSLAATLPTRLLLDIMPWNDLFVWLAALTVGMAVILFALVPENREKTSTASADKFNLFTELQGFGLIMKKLGVHSHRASVDHVSGRMAILSGIVGRHLVTGCDGTCPDAGCHIPAISGHLHCDWQSVPWSCCRHSDQAACVALSIHVPGLLFVHARPDIDHIPASQRHNGPVDAVRLLSCWPDIRLRAYFAGGTGNPFGTGGKPAQSL